MCTIENNVVIYHGYLTEVGNITVKPFKLMNYTFIEKYNNTL